MGVKSIDLRKAVNVISVLGIVVTVALCVVGLKTGIFHSPEILKEFVDSAGIFAPAAFILIQIIQVIIPIIPGGVSCLAGVLIFGPVMGFVYNYVGIFIGSVFIFLLSRQYGKPFVQNMVSEKTYNKYIGWLDKGTRFDKLFAIAIFIPISPDDFLCMLAGLTKMTLKRFVAVLCFCKPFSIVVYSFGLAFASEWLAKLLI